MLHKQIHMSSVQSNASKSVLTQKESDVVFFLKRGILFESELVRLPIIA